MVFFIMNNPHWKGLLQCATGERDLGEPFLRSLLPSLRPEVAVAGVVREALYASMWQWSALLRQEPKALAAVLRWSMEILMGSSPLVDRCELVWSMCVSLLSEGDITTKKDALLAVSHSLTQEGAQGRLNMWHSAPSLLEAVSRHMVLESVAEYALPLTVLLVTRVMYAQVLEKRLELLERLFELARRLSAPESYRVLVLDHIWLLLRSSQDYFAILPSIVNFVFHDCPATVPTSEYLLNIVEWCADADNETRFCAVSLVKALKKVRVFDSSRCDVIVTRCRLDRREYQADADL